MPIYVPFDFGASFAEYRKVDIYPSLDVWNYEWLPELP